MKAGRELDARVAKDVMGWVTVKNMGSSYWGFPTPGAYAGEIPVPQYSSDIASAWEVVKKLKVHKNYVCFECSDCMTENLMTDGDESWYAGFCLGRGYKVVGAENLPIAICLAALEAVRYTE